MAINHIVGGRGSTGSASYAPVQLVTPPYPVALPPNYGIHSPGVAGVGEAPATDATHRILNASTATLPTGWSEARSTTATYYNSSGVVSTASANTLRNDYTSAGSLRGYLLEGAATNVMTWSTSITAAQVPWHETTGNATVTSSTVSDPAGGTAGTTINFVAAGGTGGAGGAVYQQQIAVSTATVYTFSAWMRSSASSGASFVRFSTNNSLAWNTGIGQKFTLTSTWTRYSMTGVVLPTAGGAGSVINIGFDSREPVGGTWDNTIAGNVDVWGPQLELGPVATAYIPTTSATVTRAADVASFTLDAAATDLDLTYDDGSVTIYTGVPPGSTFNVPTSSTLRLLYVDDNVAAAGNVGAASGAGTATAEGTGIAASVGSAAGSGTATAGVVALNVNDKSTNITLSNGDLTATGTATPAFNYNVRGNTAGVAGRYFEVVFTTLNTGTGGAGIGLANATQSLSAYPGDPNGIGWFVGGYAEYPGSGALNWGVFAVNDALGVLLEASDAKFYKNGTLVGTAATLPSGSLYPVVSLANTGDAGTVNFGAKAFSFLPSGATGWNGLTPSTGSVGAASGSGTATAVGASTAASQGASSGSATVTAVGASTARSSASVAGSGAATAVGASTAASVGSAAGSGAATAVGASTARSAGTSAGSGAATAVGASTAVSVGSAAGSSTVTAVGASTAASVGSSTGSGTATAKSISSAVGSSAGTGSATAVGIATALGVGSAAGTETVTAVGAATDVSVGSSTGSSTASAVGASSATGIGASAGSGAATAIGAATASGVGSSAGHATAAAFTGIVAQANGSGAASGVGASTASAVGSASGTATVTAVSSSASVGSSSGTASVSGVGLAISVAVGSSTGIGSASGTASAATGSAVGSAAGSGSAAGIAPAAVVSAIGTAAGSGISSAFSASTDFSSDFGGDFAHQPISTELDFGGDFSNDFAVLQSSIFSRDFGDDFNDDFAVLHAFSQDFNSDFSDDFAVYHVTTVVSAVGRAAGASIVSGAIFGFKAGTPDVDLPPDVEPPPPVYPPPPPPIPLVWHPAQEYRRVQAPRAIRIHRRGTELRKAIPRSMKRRYG